MSAEKVTAPNLEQKHKTMNLSVFLQWIRRFQSILGLIVVVILASILCVRDGSNLFLDPVNLANIVRAVSENGIIAIGMTLVILIAGIDLSVGAILGLTATAAADLMMNKGFGLFSTLLIVLLLGAFIGWLNGIVVTKLSIQSFIVTLATMSIARGVARFWSGGIGVPISYGNKPHLAPPAFGWFADRISGVPVPAICFIVISVIFYIVLKYTRFGRYVYAIGGNETAGHLSGIKINRIKITVFVICGVLSAFAGIIHAAQLSQGSPNDGIGYELNAIAAVAIGGDNKLIGKKAGEFVAKLLGSKGGNVVESKGLEGATPQQERHDGFMEGISSNPNIKIIAAQNADWLKDKAITVMDSILQANKHIDVVFGHNDPSALGAYISAKNANRQNEMKFIGIDGLPTPDGGIKAVMDGTLAATYVYPTGGKEAIDNAIKILEKKEKVPKTQILDTIEVTKDNAEQVYKQFGGQ